MLLTIENLHANVEDQAILKGINLTINPGETHAIMGPNGAGKSTLGNVISGKPGYEVTQGKVLLNGQDLLVMEPEQRAAAGMFLGFQYPVEIPGVSNTQFLKTAVNSLRKAQGSQPLEAADFMRQLRQAMTTLEMDQKYMKRGVNEGFSGGEKKRNEMLQMMMLQPKMAVLDETDSGLDIDALKVVAKSVNEMRDDQRGFMLITHYQRLLDYIVPDFVHVLVDGQIIKSGDKTLAHQLESEGYANLAV